METKTPLSFSVKRAYTEPLIVISLDNQKDIITASPAYDPDQGEWDVE